MQQEIEESKLEDEVMHMSTPKITTKTQKKSKNPKTKKKVEKKINISLSDEII